MEEECFENQRIVIQEQFLSYFWSKICCMVYMVLGKNFLRYPESLPKNPHILVGVFCFKDDILLYFKVQTFKDDFWGTIFFLDTTIRYNLNTIIGGYPESLPQLCDIVLAFFIFVK